MTLTRATLLDGDAILPLDDAKAHLRVLHDDEDDLIASLRDAAISHVERTSGVALAPSGWLWTMPRFPAWIELPMSPATELGNVTYLDSAGATQSYTGARLVGNVVYPAAGGVFPIAYMQASVSFTAGLTSPDKAPDLLAAVKIFLTHLYENRGATSDRPVSEIPLGVDALIQTYRQVLV